MIIVIIVRQLDDQSIFSGYAYSFTQEPENIHIMRKWEGDDPGINNQKTPTILLLTPNKVGTKICDTKRFLHTYILRMVSKCIPHRIKNCFHYNSVSIHLGLLQEIAIMTWTKRKQSSGTTLIR